MKYPSSLRVTGQVTHPYKTKCKIEVLCILIFMFRQDMGRWEIMNGR
jgi:hypothetical protein